MNSTPKNNPVTSKTSVRRCVEKTGIQIDGKVLWINPDNTCQLVSADVLESKLTSGVAGIFACSPEDADRAIAYYENHRKDVKRARKYTDGLMERLRAGRAGRGAR